jgi:hypothetical protein
VWVAIVGGVWFEAQVLCWQLVSLLMQLLSSEALEVDQVGPILVWSSMLLRATG